MKKPIRVLHVLGRLDRGGAETMIMNLYRNIDHRQIQFDFIIHTAEKCDFSQEVYKLGGKYIPFQNIMVKIILHIEKHGIISLKDILNIQ